MSHLTAAAAASFCGYRMVFPHVKAEAPMPTSFTHHASGLARSLAPQGLLRARRERHFFGASGWQNLHHGVFSSFSEAAAYARERGARTRYAIDHQEWLATHQELRAHDYPVLYWLGKLLHWESALVDFGGSVGASYYVYAERLQLPSEFRWTVCEMPEVAQAGREIAAARGANQLEFTDDPACIDGARILLAAGVVQVLEEGAPGLLGARRRRPNHVLINRIPLCRGRPGFVTLQNTGQSIIPVRVDNYDEFIAMMQGLGYTLIDRWKCLENSMVVPGDEETALGYFDGLYFYGDFGPPAAP